MPKNIRLYVRLYIRMNVKFQELRWELCTYRGTRSLLATVSASSGRSIRLPKVPGTKPDWYPEITTPVQRERFKPLQSHAPVRKVEIRRQWEWSLQLLIAGEPSARWECAVRNSSLKDALLFIGTCYTCKSATTSKGKASFLTPIHMHF